MPIRYKLDEIAFAPASRMLGRPCFERTLDAPRMTNRDPGTHCESGIILSRRPTPN
jgi:hypothetical protein